MTTTPELHELARDPHAFDIVRARLDDERGKHSQEIARATARLHELAGDRKSYRNTRSQVWGLADHEVISIAQRAAAHGDQSARVVLTSLAGARVMLEAIDHERGNMDMVYVRQGNRWTRFFPSITASHPHIHRSLTCRTLHADTQMIWAPELSGHTDAEAVDKLDEALCSVCFPDAPVALHEYVSKRSQAEQAERQAAKDERASKLAAKTLDPQAEAFRTRYGHDHVTTVAGCKDIIRRSVELAVEVDWYDTPAAADKWAGHDPEALARVRRNVRDNLDQSRQDAAEARRVLVAREAAHAGWGMTDEAIEQMIARKDKAARKEWNL